MKRNYKDQIYMFDGDKDSVYLSNVVTDPDIQVGEHTYYNDFLKDPRDFQKNNVLYIIPRCTTTKSSSANTVPLPAAPPSSVPAVFTVPGLCLPIPLAWPADTGIFLRSAAR